MYSFNAFNEIRAIFEVTLRVYTVAASIMIIIEQHEHESLEIIMSTDYYNTTIISSSACHLNANK